jgi:enoyl-CoA hydratase/carnithine racemase
VQAVAAEETAALEAAADPAVKVIVLTGAGRGFSAGLDLGIIGSGAGGRVETAPGIAPQWGDEIGPDMARFFSGPAFNPITPRAITPHRDRNLSVITRQIIFSK